MPDSRFAPKERGVDPASRQTSTEPVANAPKSKTEAAQPQGFAKGVIFLLNERGHQRHQMQLTSGVPDNIAREQGSQLYENTLLLRDKLNRSLRTANNLPYDPLETRLFSTLADILAAAPSRDVAGGKWAGATILTHTTFNIESVDRVDPGLWMLPAGYFAPNFREFGNSDDPQFSSFREKFEPSGDLNILVCGVQTGSVNLACALLAFFGLSGKAFMPKTSITVREDGELWAKLSDDTYRPYNPKRDSLTVQAAQCGRR